MLFHRIRSTFLKTTVAVFLLAGTAPATAAPAAEMAGRGNTGSACLKTGTEADARRTQAIRLMLDNDTRPTKSAYRREIRDLSARYGPLDERLVPAFVNLGLLYKKDHAYGRATHDFRQALHVFRVNRGLYSLAQVPIINLVIDSGKAGHEWKQVDRAYNLMYWVYTRNYGPDDPRLLPMLRRVHRWHLQAYNKETGLTLAQHYKLTKATHDQAVRIIGKCTGDPRLAACYLAGTDNGQCGISKIASQGNFHPAQASQ